MGRALIVVVMLVALLVATAWGLQRRLIYFPGPGPVPTADSVIPTARDVTLHTSDGLELGAWFIPPEEPARTMTVLVANGNGGDRAGRAPLAHALAARGFAVLLFDYRGYAGNPGSPTEAGLARDVRAAHDYLVTTESIDPSRLIYFGESLGAAVVTQLATEHPPAGLVLRSPFVSLGAVGRVHYPFLPVGLLLRDEFPVADRIAGIDVPTTVVYGQADSIVPPEQSRAVADAAADLFDRVAVPGADHNDTELAHGDATVAAVVRLAVHVGQRRR